jgi:hypothetical protein
MRTEDIHQLVRILKKETRQWSVPAIDRYKSTPFTVLISCLLSLRTQDRTTIAASDRLFVIARTPRHMLATPAKAIEKAIYPVSFYRVKTLTIHAICQQLIKRFKGKVPSTIEDLLSLPGVGRKTANIVLTLGFRSRESRSIPTFIESRIAWATCVRGLRRKRRWLSGGSCQANTGSYGMTSWLRTDRTCANPSAHSARHAAFQSSANVSASQKAVSRTVNPETRKNYCQHLPRRFL